MTSNKLMFALAMMLFVVPAAVASSTWYVDGINGNDNNNCMTPQTACKTIGHAIPLASSGDSIMVAPATYTESLFITISLKILGANASTTIIDGGGVHTVVTIFNTAAHVSLSKVTIQNGSGTYPSGGGITNSGILTVSSAVISNNKVEGDKFGWGGGIFNTGTLTISNSIVSGNEAGGRYPAGGGIYNSQGTLSLNKTTVNGNFAKPTICYAYHPCGASGGGISNWGTANITNSTVSGNGVSNPGCLHCAAGGGGIIVGEGTLLISNSTISGNSASGTQAGGGGISNFGSLISISSSTISGNSVTGFHGAGGGINGTATLQNTIIANNSGGNCDSTMTSDGYNLSSDNTCNFNGTGDMNNTDPVLGTLGNYGGPTQTVPLLAGSPAIDAGNPGGCTDGNGHLLKTDQRGKPRPDHEDSGGCDMGAYERQKD